MRWLAVAAGLLLLASLTSAPTEVDAAIRVPTPTPKPMKLTLSIFGSRFTPKLLRVTPGSEIRWQNGDRVSHTVTSTIARSAEGIVLGSRDSDGVVSCDDTAPRPCFAFNSNEIPARELPVRGQSRKPGSVVGPITFTTPGTYSYQCLIHTRMTGTIVVR